mmetsp:Transcript_24754/g.68957  ORF Transcript_24754/g.68957 Transcript_24754/m.68957 type:complete len:230 (-) Transcript_24754:1492-2181(-)
MDREEGDGRRGRRLDGALSALLSLLATWTGCKKAAVLEFEHLVAPAGPAGLQLSGKHLQEPRAVPSGRGAEEIRQQRSKPWLAGVTPRRRHKDSHGRRWGGARAAAAVLAVLPPGWGGGLVLGLHSAGEDEGLVGEAMQAVEGRHRVAVVCDLEPVPRRHLLQPPVRKELLIDKAPEPRPVCHPQSHQRPLCLGRQQLGHRQLQEPAGREGLVRAPPLGAGVLPRRIKH